MENPGYHKAKEYLLELGYELVSENDAEGLMIVDNEETGIKNLMVICSEPLVIIEQFMFEVQNESAALFRQLLQKNRDLIHGAFVLDETGRKVLFRDTLQMENLDMNEMESSLNALNLLLSEYSQELINLSKN